MKRERRKKQDGKKKKREPKPKRKKGKHKEAWSRRIQRHTHCGWKGRRTKDRRVSKVGEPSCTNLQGNLCYLSGASETKNVHGRVVTLFIVSKCLFKSNW